MRESTAYNRAYTSHYIFIKNEAVSQLLLTPKILLLFGFKALFAFLFLPILSCWTASYSKKKIAKNSKFFFVQGVVKLSMTIARGYANFRMVISIF